MGEAVEKKLLSELLEETELNADVLEKIGFAGRAFYVLSLIHIWKRTVCPSPRLRCPHL